jgi:predicted MPP superfamily phosphohydrolase
MDNPLWINKGLGCVGFPLRFRAAPELTLIRLVPPSEVPPKRN